MNERKRKVIIGLSPRILRHVPRELGFRDKTLQYLEQSMAHCVMRLGAVAVMIPTVEDSSDIHRWEVATEDYIAELDGLILQGGADLDPTIYGETPTDVLGPTDAVRDRFELELLQGFAAAGKPVLGVCRGMQLINVAYGGTLYQDLEAAGASKFQHRMADLYDAHQHEVQFIEGGWLQSVYGGAKEGRVTSIHHQGVHVLGKDLIVDAVSTDGVMEAIRHREYSFMVGVQWHPEFHDARFPG
ncbi:gamma-glutamyl-gamma-aminobutyrate hydrolase family protein, partial [Povalibacter sp.]|uniref:gamma-glutamyl-gamma-aminobutyrate hydrolase family protein n=1 Tax=Povalibacter sp. TaxID=1962978 RepID=UPI002F3E6F80